MILLTNRTDTAAYIPCAKHWFGTLIHMYIIIGLLPVASIMNMNATDTCPQKVAKGDCHASTHETSTEVATLSTFKRTPRLHRKDIADSQIDWLGRGSQLGQ